MRGTLTEIVIAIGEEFEAAKEITCTEYTGNTVAIEIAPTLSGGYIGPNVVRWLNHPSNHVRPVGILFVEPTSLSARGKKEISRRIYRRGLGAWFESNPEAAQPVQQKRAKVDRFDDTHEEFAVRRREVNDP